MGRFIPDAQVPQFAEMIQWYQRVGRHITGPGQRPGKGPRLPADRRMKGLLKGAITSTSTSATVDNVTNIIGTPPTTSSTGEVTVDLQSGLVGEDNSEVRFEWARSSSAWEIYSGVSTGVEVVSEYRWSTGDNELQQKTRTIYTLATPASTWTTIIGAATCT